MLIAEATFKITGWLGGQPKFYQHQGSNGTFEVASMQLSVAKRVKGQDGVWKNGDFKRFYVRVSGKSVEFIKKDVEAGLWNNGDLIVVEGVLDTIPASDTDKDQPDGKRAYERIICKANNVTNLDSYIKRRLDRKKDTPANTSPVNDGIPQSEEPEKSEKPEKSKGKDKPSKGQSVMSFEDFPFGGEDKPAQDTPFVF